LSRLHKLICNIPSLWNCTLFIQYILVLSSWLMILLIASSILFKFIVKFLNSFFILSLLSAYLFIINNIFFIKCFGDHQITRSCIFSTVIFRFLMHIFNVINR
jgi:hypothetical protein